METKYTIKNFRVFDEGGVSVSLKPLTLLTGCNSSGKSSLVKSLLLISDYFAAIKSDDENSKRIDLTAYKLDFTKSPHSSLGKFSKTVNNKSEKKSVTFCFQTHSDMLCQDVYLELVFAADETDSTNGYIKSLSVMKLDGTIIFHSDAENKSTGNLHEIFDEFVRFAYTQHMISSYESMALARYIGDRNTMSDVEFEELEKKMTAHFTEIKDEYGRSVLIDINRWNNRHGKQSFIDKFDKDANTIEYVKEYGILYYIPFIGEKLNGGKDEVCSVLEECKNDEDTDIPTSYILSKIINDFKASTFDTFKEYYKNWEKNYLANFKMWAHFSYATKYPNIPDVRGVGLSANKITMSPYLTRSIASFHRDDLKFKNISKEETEKKKAEEIAEWEALPLTFEAIFESLCIMSEKYCSKEQNFFCAPSCIGRFSYSSRTERLFLAFIEEAIKEVVLNAMPNALSYISSSVINVKRLYPLESADEFTQILKRFIEAKRNMDKGLDYEANTFINKWVKAFGIGEKISVNVDPEGLGVTLRLHKNESDNTGTLLADNGYGITQLFAILLNIEVCIMERTVCEMDADDFIGAYTATDRIKVISSPTIAIEEPEIHLHPSYQSMLADMFYDAYRHYGIHFLIETHSEYLIRKTQIIVSKFGYQTNCEAEEKCPFATYYVPQTGIPYLLGYRKDGKFMESFGTGFYDEASNLAFEIL